MSNVDRLSKAHVLNPDALSPAQKDFINHKLTREDVDDLIKIGHKLAPSGVKLITSPVS